MYMQQIDLGLLWRGSTHCTTMHQSNLQAQAHVLPTGHTIHCDSLRDCTVPRSTGVETRQSARTPYCYSAQA